VPRSLCRISKRVAPDQCSPGVTNILELTVHNKQAWTNGCEMNHVFCCLEPTVQCERRVRSSWLEPKAKRDKRQSDTMKGRHSGTSATFVSVCPRKPAQSCRVGAGGMRDFEVPFVLTSDKSSSRHCAAETKVTELCQPVQSNRQSFVTCVLPCCVWRTHCWKEQTQVPWMQSVFGRNSVCRPKTLQAQVVEVPTGVQIQKTRKQSSNDP
jgi:hypothetical protein